MSDFKGNFIGTYFGKDKYESDLQDEQVRGMLIFSLRDNFNFNPEMVATEIVNLMTAVFLLKKQLAELEGKK